MRDSYRLVRGNSPVKYQKRNLTGDWHRFHIKLNDYEYEYCLDMRKFYKMSVSLIVAYAVSNYLDEIIIKLLDTNMREVTDNYHYKNYILIQEIIDSTICWKIYWGIPYNLEKINLLPTQDGFNQNKNLQL